MRSARLLAVTVLAVMLAASAPHQVSAGTWLSYDDGTPGVAYAYKQGTQVAVRFSLPPEWSTAQVLTGRYYIMSGSASFGVHVYDASMTELTPPGVTVTPSQTGWLDVDLSGYGIIVTGDFYVSLEWLTTLNPYVGADSDDNPSGRSWDYWVYTPPNGVWELDSVTDFIRAEVGPPAPSVPVGGVMTPVNNFAILAPWLAVIGLVGCIGTVVAVGKPWKKREN